MTENDESPAPAEGPARSWRAAIAAEVRDRPFVYVVFGAFVVAGPVVVHVLFPEAPRGVGLVGGVAFGAYAALCAMPGRFL